MDKSQAQPRPKSHILSRLGLENDVRPGQPVAEEDARRQARQIEFVDLMLQTKRRKLIQSLSSRIDQLAEQRIATALSINDLRLSRAAGDIVSIATDMARRKAGGSEVSTTKGVKATSFQDSPDLMTSRVEQHPKKCPSTTRPSRLPPQPTQSQHSRLHVSDPNLSISSTSSSAAAAWATATTSPHSPAREVAARLPTQMSYEELRKHPDFKRLSWSWTGLIVGIPVLLVTSWVIYKDYDRRMKERKLGLHLSSTLSPPSTFPSSSSSSSTASGEA